MTLSHSELQGNVLTVLKSLLLSKFKSLLAKLIHVRLDILTSIYFAHLSNDKLKEEEHLPRVPVKPGTVYRFLCEKYQLLNLSGTLFEREF